MPALFGDYAKADRHDREQTHNGEPCILCGRKVVVNAKTVWIHLVDGGHLIAEADADPNAFEPSGDVGWFPVGSNCASRLPKSCRGTEWRDYEVERS